MSSMSDRRDGARADHRECRFCGYTQVPVDEKFCPRCGQPFVGFFVVFLVVVAVWGGVMLLSKLLSG
jgi:hypothetical protein